MHCPTPHWTPALSLSLVFIYLLCQALLATLFELAVHRRIQRQPQRGESGCVLVVMMLAVTAASYSTGSSWGDIPD